MPNGRELIDSLKRSDGQLDRRALRTILPYGDDFLFVDSVTRLTDREVDATFRIPPDSPYVQSHFVGLPLMPGALICEGLAQAGTVIVRYNLESPADKDILAFQVESARFPSAALPGQVLRYRVRLQTMSRRAARLEGEAEVDDRIVCKARVVVGITDRKDLEARLAAD
jgi:3-hydroxyacyl-[acyl-carrier-protein] dehydratase